MADCISIFICQWPRTSCGVPAPAILCACFCWTCHCYWKLLVLKLDLCTNSGAETQSTWSSYAPRRSCHDCRICLAYILMDSVG